MIRIFSADLLPIDVIVPADGHALAEKYGLKPGSKTVMDKAQFEALSKDITAYPTTAAPGGSSANMLVTLARLLGAEVNIQFLGIPGGGEYGKSIRASLEEVGITLLPENSPSGAQTVISYVLMFQDGQRAIATWPGNARDMLTPEMITEAMAKNTDALLVQGSLWNKFGPGIPDRMLKLCKQHQKELWLTLPTQGTLTPKEAAAVRARIPEAALLLGNDGELTRVFGGTFEESLASLQKTLGKAHVAFITCGERGAAVVTAADIERIPPVPVAHIVNTLGAGDTAFAGFAAGYLRGLPHSESANIAEALAAQKLAVDGPRLRHPKLPL